jgi:hypothetical protein
LANDRRNSPNYNKVIVDLKRWIICCKNWRNTQEEV